MLNLNELQTERKIKLFVVNIFNTYFDKNTKEDKIELDYQINDCSSLEELESVFNSLIEDLYLKLEIDNLYDILEETYEICKEIILEVNEFDLMGR